ncbi:hypothetical protein RUM43_002949 [Polyplax serrata]|uniref:Uncharacterized protein n=1 Tax=Polyplax serrata TaxID=468196 RepID=A0AAN8PEP1_POLSC
MDMDMEDMEVHRRLNPIHFILFTLDFFLLVLTIYAFLCVVSQYQEYKAGRGRAEDDAIRYPISHVPPPTATSCLSTRKPGTYHETTATEPMSTMVSSNDFGMSSPFHTTRKHSASVSFSSLSTGASTASTTATGGTTTTTTKHVQFGISDGFKQSNGLNQSLW